MFSFNVHTDPSGNFHHFLICLSSLHPQRLLPSITHNPLRRSLLLSFHCCLLGFINFTQYCPSSLTFSCDCQSHESQQRPPPPQPIPLSLRSLHSTSWALSLSFCFFPSRASECFFLISLLAPSTALRAEMHPLLLLLLAVSTVQVSAELNCCQTLPSFSLAIWVTDVFAPNMDSN